MAIYYQKKNGRIYAYNSTSSRVPGKKNPVSTNEYLGVVDPETGEIIPKKVRATKAHEGPPTSGTGGNGEIYALRYGSVMFLDAVQRSLHIEEDLNTAFPDLSRKILATAMAQVLEPSVMDDIHITMEESVITNLLHIRGELSPAVLSEMTKDIGMSMVSMEEFFDQRYARQSNGSYAIDITSESTYGDLQGWAEWGYNRDGERLKQVNWLLITDSEGVPMSFEMLPGSVSDTTTLKQVVDSLKDRGLDGTAVFDRGFESASNVRYLLKNGIRFVTPSNMVSKALKSILTDCYPLVRDPRNQDILDGNRYGHVTVPVGISPKSGKGDCDGYVYVTEKDDGWDSAVRCCAHVIYDPDADVRKTNSFMNDIHSMRDRLEGLKYPEACKELQRRKDLANTLSIDTDEEGKVTVEINWNSVSFNNNRAGIYIVLTPEGIGWSDAISAYELRNQVEEAYDAYKNDLDGKRLRTPDADRARGRFFVRYISLMMIIYIRRCLSRYRESLPASKRKDDRIHNMSVREVIRSLNSVMAVGNTGNWKLTHITKTNRQIFSAFGIADIATGKVMERKGYVCKPPEIGS